MNRRNIGITYIFLGVIKVIVGVLVLGGVVMGFWNLILPQLFGWPAVTFWQALGLFILAKIFFGGFGGGRLGGVLRGDIRGCNPLRDKWLKMTNEERKEFFKKHAYGHFQQWAGPAEAKASRTKKK
ncbi:hypothetical protein RDn1_152 [Candidatus Termititenax dinenymphae]|uniref:Uncharacterized protein n=1 Tax=Candidatus Termititenax dinenymphae TaxID=2218523 RepID=A0A388TJL5_9BACT|nr:hypothetical protein RDn1_152 [Candidatus Termititenax dinenymphae]